MQKHQKVKTFKSRCIKPLSHNCENINVYPDYKPKPPPCSLQNADPRGSFALPPRREKFSPPARLSRDASLSAPLRFAPLRSALDRRALAGYLVPGRGQSKAQQSSPHSTRYGTVFGSLPLSPASPPVFLLFLTLTCLISGFTANRRCWRQQAYAFGRPPNPLKGDPQGMQTRHLLSPPSSQPPAHTPQCHPDT